MEGPETQTVVWSEAQHAVCFVMGEEDEGWGGGGEGGRSVPG